MPYAVSALLEPLSVAIHASRRAQIAPGTSTLIFGAGTVGLLCAAMSKLNGSNNVIIADVQEQRTSFAVKHGFAHEGFTVPFQKGNIIEEKLQIAQTTAALAGRARGGPNENTAKFDTVFECTGVEACTQAAIYVGFLELKLAVTEYNRQHAQEGESCWLEWVRRFKLYQYPPLHCAKLILLARSAMQTHTLRQ